MFKVGDLVLVYQVFCNKAKRNTWMSEWSLCVYRGSFLHIWEQVIFNRCSFSKPALIYSSLQCTGHPPISTNTPCNLLIIKAGFSLYWGHLASHFLAHTPATWCSSTTSLYFNLQDKQSGNCENKVSKEFKKERKKEKSTEPQNSVIFRIRAQIWTRLIYIITNISFVVPLMILFRTI